MPLVGAPETGIVLSGRSKSWAGGGCAVTSANLDHARSLIAHVVDTHVPEPVVARRSRPHTPAAGETRLVVRVAEALAAAAPIGTGLTGTAGEYYVAAELSRRGWLATVTIKNAPGTDVLAQRADRTRLVAIQTKTASPGSRFRLSKKDEDPGTTDNEWYVLVALGGLDERPTFYVVPRHIVAAVAWLEHREWLSGEGRLHSAAPPGRRNPNDGRTIKHEWIDGYRERWDLLGTWTPSDRFLGDPVFVSLARELHLPKEYGKLR